MRSREAAELARAEAYHATREAAERTRIEATRTRELSATIGEATPRMRTVYAQRTRMGPCGNIIPVYDAPPTIRPESLGPPDSDRGFASLSVGGWSARSSRRGASSHRSARSEMKPVKADTQQGAADWWKDRPDTRPWATDDAPTHGLARASASARASTITTARMESRHSSGRAATQRSHHSAHPQAFQSRRQMLEGALAAEAGRRRAAELEADSLAKQIREFNRLNPRERAFN